MSRSILKFASIEDINISYPIAVILHLTGIVFSVLVLAQVIIIPIIVKKYFKGGKLLSYFFIFAPLVFLWLYVLLNWLEDLESNHFVAFSLIALGLVFGFLDRRYFQDNKVLHYSLILHSSILLSFGIWGVGPSLPIPFSNTPYENLFYWITRSLLMLIPCAYAGWLYPKRSLVIGLPVAAVQAGMLLLTTYLVNRVTQTSLSFRQIKIIASLFCLFIVVNVLVSFMKRKFIPSGNISN